MIWREDDKRDEQQKKIEYARDLEQQIELRKAIDREEKLQHEEWERQNVEPKDEQSPAKWWTELRSADTPNRFGFHMDASALPSAALEQTELVDSDSALVPHQRFQTALGDPLTSLDRLREKAQQMEWKRILDEQVREKERRMQQEAEEKRLSERKEAQEEMQLLRERQLRAQRKLGIVGFTSAATYAPQNYVTIPSPPAPEREFRRSRAEMFAQQYPTQEHDVYPPPAPVQADTVDYNFRRAMGLTDAPQPLASSQNHVTDEYRALLVEIRREREELRRERDEVRREKEELRMERQLMQMENEKMATLLESQRHMNEQRLETMDRLDRALEVRATPEAPSPPYTRQHALKPLSPQYTRQHATTPRPTRPPSPLHVVQRDHSVHHLQNSIAALNVGNRAQPSPVHQRRHSRLGAMSMADFASPRNPRLSPVATVNSPRARRYGRFRQRADDEQSLAGESEFVALSPRATELEYAPRITETRSPAASMMDPRSATRMQANPLRNSRVIKSRGFYDFNREEALPVQREPRMFADHHRSPLRTQRADLRRADGPDGEEESDVDETEHRHDREYSDGDDDQGGSSEFEDHDGTSVSGSDRQTDSELSCSLFQVQVLVKD